MLVLSGLVVMVTPSQHFLEGGEVVTGGGVGGDLVDEYGRAGGFGELIPPPVRKMPILIGGTGPKRTLPLVVHPLMDWNDFRTWH
jgi:hypothetical protein